MINIILSFNKVSLKGRPKIGPKYQHYFKQVQISKTLVQNSNRIGSHARSLRIVEWHLKETIHILPNVPKLAKRKQTLVHFQIVWSTS